MRRVLEVDGAVKLISVVSRDDGLGMTVHDSPGPGVEVMALEPAGAAAKAGLSIGDILLKANGVECYTHAQSVQLLRAPAGTLLELEVLSSTVNEELVSAIIYANNTPPEQVLK